MINSAHFLYFQILLFTTASDALIPAECQHNVTVSPAICCPAPPKHKNACGYPQRGTCRPTNAYRPPWLKTHKLIYADDIRVDWPMRLFQNLCECRENFWGVDCGSCRFGYEGPNCQHKVVYMRRDIRSYTTLERQRFLAVLNESRHTPSSLVKPHGLKIGEVKGFSNMTVHEAVVYVHYFTAVYNYNHTGREGIDTCNSFLATDLNHNQSTFILWHRLFILWWERELRTISTERFGWRNFTLPYWDYTDARECEVCTPDFLCEPAEKVDTSFATSCSISEWISYCSQYPCDNCESNITRTLRRHFDLQKKRDAEGLPPFPSSNETLLTLKAPYYFSFADCKGGFSNMIELGCTCRPYFQMHDLVHNIFDGDMRGSYTAPNDPLFLFHHSQLDRLLHRWILSVKPSVDEIPFVDIKVPHICRYCALVGFLPLMDATDLLVDLKELGVTYDHLNFGDISEDMEIKPITDTDELKHAYCGNISDEYSKLVNFRTMVYAKLQIKSSEEISDEIEETYHKLEDIDNALSQEELW